MLVLQIHSSIIATNAGTVLTQDNIIWQSIQIHAPHTAVLRYMQLFALINCRSFHRTCVSDSGRAVDSRRNKVWNGRPEHTITRGDAESTNQNRITLSSFCSLVYGRTERYKIYQTGDCDLYKTTTENSNWKSNGWWTNTGPTETVKGKVVPVDVTNR